LKDRLLLLADRNCLGVVDDKCLLNQAYNGRRVGVGEGRGDQEGIVVGLPVRIMHGRKLITDGKGLEKCEEAKVEVVKIRSKFLDLVVRVLRKYILLEVRSCSYSFRMIRLLSDCLEG